MQLPAKAALVGLPFDQNSSFMTGPAIAPSRIRETLHNDSGNYWTENGINPIEDSRFRDMGDLPIPGYLGIQQSVGQVMDQGYRILSLGGDHSVSYPILRAHHERYLGFAILQIDAHGDLYDNFMGNRYSHASPFARIMEEGLCDRLVQVGVRTLNPHQRQQADRFGVEIIEMKDYENQWESIRFNRPVYISLDMDGIDPAFAPGVSHHEPGGLSVRQVMDLLQRINAPIIGADLVELNPHRDLVGITAALAAKLTKELLAMLLNN